MVNQSNNEQSTNNVERVAQNTSQINNGNIKTLVELWINNSSSFASGETNFKYGHISDWDTSNVTDMSELFKSKEEFNEDISKWNVSSVTNMKWMFRQDYGASLFNQSLNTCLLYTSDAADD